MIDAPWLDAALARFDARLARGQMPQALLVYGSAGIGRRHFALALAARLLGSAWRPSLDVPADQLGGVPHPDYWSVGLEDESRVIKIDQIRELIQALSLTSHSSGWKVGHVWPAELMNHNAANTLLKTLEEPPAATTLILVADAPARLPATILSRCERIRLSLPSPAMALGWLTGRHPDQAACERALAFSSGAPLMARSLLADDTGPGVARLLAELGDDLQQLIDRKTTPITVARSWAKRDAAICLRWLYLQTAALLRDQTGAAGHPASALLHLKIPGPALNMAACCAHLEQVMEAQRLKDRSLNMEAMFADLLMWWYGAAGAAR
ncbi:MAG: DNA polymerase III subunit delta' [Gammaproteobacteria bacterium]|nr:DNA polymerase III subunit delta' [Gammaproteobacteria bacterium]